MVKYMSKDAQAFIKFLRSDYSAAPTDLKIVILLMLFAGPTTAILVIHRAMAGFHFNSFLSGVLSRVGAMADFWTENGTFISVSVITGTLTVWYSVKRNKEDKIYRQSIAKREENLASASTSKHASASSGKVKMVKYMSKDAQGFIKSLRSDYSAAPTDLKIVILFMLFAGPTTAILDLPPERAFADFVLCNLVLYLVVMNFMG